MMKLKSMKAAEKDKDGNRTRIRPRAKRIAASSPSLAPTASGIQLKQILVPIDFSKPSLKALKYAEAFASQFSASIHLVHVVEPASFLYGVRNLPLPISDREVTNQLHHKLVMLARKEIDPLTPVYPLVCIGKPFAEIVRTAKTFKADLIIIATHGRTGFKRAVLGSTAEWVVHHAHCPVLVLRQKTHDFVQHDEPSTQRELL
jgi:nucleotide-binding universal stress UspA family protein